MVCGKFAASRSHLEHALALYDPIADPPLARRTETSLGWGTDTRPLKVHPGVNSQSFLGIALFCLGFPDQALAQSSAAIVEARRLADPPSLFWSLALGSALISLIGDSAALGKLANQRVAVPTEQGLPVLRAQGAIYRGWVKVKSGYVAEGISLLRGGLTAYRATGAEVGMPHFYALLGGIAGQSKMPRPCWTTPCGSSRGQGSAGSQRSYTGSKVRCYCGKDIPTPPKSCTAKR
jgi:hypothetical protein